jgi:hypothetical protein
MTLKSEAEEVVNVHGQSAADKYRIPGILSNDCYHSQVSQHSSGDQLNGANNWVQMHASLGSCT